ncbi:hypothetical protein [Epilithonimonas tenax]|uniref:hypothetical protein n=1 Tax=Epilithonimonas tenax TaxID=191577 RepID=UPI00047F45C1|nr:hypothetical protein [Epilithonimonas tenax]
MLPLKKLNIYPKSKENVQALIDFYFGDIDIGQRNALEILEKYPYLSLNQIEFIILKLSEAYEPIFRTKLNGKIQFSNLFSYGVQALVEDNVTNSSNNRNLITKEFRDFVVCEDKY